MKNTACPLCSKQENEKCFSERNHDVLACKNCGLFFIHPYGNDVHKKVSTYDYDNLEILDPAKHHVSSKSYYKKKYISYIRSECATAQSILDVGCGTGSLLELLYDENSNIQSVGIELNTERAEFAKRVSNCEIYQVPIEQFTYDSKFDVITMINVLSHIPSIDNLFTSIRNLLAPDGKLILKVGEMAADVKKDAVFDWGIPDHLHFLGIDTIQFICSKYGFKIIRHERQPLSADLFSFSRWLTPGRSPIRNIVKRVVALTPFALLILRTLYDIRHGKEIYSSFIVISPAHK
ncbi:MAG: class I SAM-dependent methyltransferase [Deltaproteobacteria bacterium]|nr:class I SAM-dependent methyltransferase [Deltaproteobacteria bacterium]